MPPDAHEPGLRVREMFTAEELRRLCANCGARFGGHQAGSNACADPILLAASVARVSRGKNPLWVYPEHPTQFFQAVSA